jgi:hypothetical protein
MRLPPTTGVILIGSGERKVVGVEAPGAAMMCWHCPQPWLKNAMGCPANAQCLKGRLSKEGVID